MQAFLISCAVAVVVAFGAVFALDALQKPSSTAYTAPSSVRL
jgi:hypothetical protein